MSLSCRNQFSARGWPINGRKTVAYVVVLLGERDHSWMTHFGMQAPPSRQKESYDRLINMHTFRVVTGDDRREEVQPNW